MRKGQDICIVFLCLAIEKPRFISSVLLEDQNLTLQISHKYPIIIVSNNTAFYSTSPNVCVCLTTILICGHWTLEHHSFPSLELKKAWSTVNKERSESV